MHTESVLPAILGLQPYEWLTLVGIIVGPIVAVLISLWMEKRRSDRERKTIFLRLLLTTRHLAGDPSYSAAVNLIPIEFSGNRDVQSAYREYIDSVFAKRMPDNNDELNAKSAVKQTRLIFAIAKSVGFKHIAETDIQTTAYAAEGWIQRDSIAVDSQKAMRDIANILWFQTRLSAGESWEQITASPQPQMQGKATL